MALRVTQHFVEFATGDAESSDLRVTDQWIDVLASGYDYDPDLRVTDQWIDVVASGYDYAPSLRITALWMDVCATNIQRGFTSLLGTARSSLAGSTLLLGHPLGLPAEIQPTAPVYEEPVSAYTGMLATFNSLLGVRFQLGSETLFAPSYNVHASDALELDDDGPLCNAIYQRVAIDDGLSLSLDDLVQRVFEVVSFDLVSFGEQAAAVLVRASYDTLSLSDEAIADVQVTRHVTDDLVVNDTDGATFVGVYPRSAADNELATQLQDTAAASVVYRRRVFEALSLSEQAARILTASDSLVLSEAAVADRILSSGDALVLSDEATSSTEHTCSASDTLDFSSAETATPGHTTQRDEEDTLSFVEDAIGDRCRVVDEETLVITDVADAEKVRLIHDELTLDDDTGATYVGVFYRSAWDTITATDEANTDRELDAAASDAIGLLEDAAVIFDAPEETLVITDVASVDKCKYAIETVELYEYADATRDRITCSDDLSLSEVASYNITRNVRAQDAGLILDERAWPGFHRVEASDAVQVEYVDYDPETYEPIITYTGLQDTATSALVPSAAREVSDRLYPAERAECIKINAGAIEAIASDALVLTEKASRNRLGDATDTLALTETAAVVSSKLLVEDLELTETASFSIVRNNLSASDTLSIGEAILYYNALEDYLYAYHPFVGTGPSSNPDPPDIELDGPIPGITDPFKLVYPVVGPFSDTLVLRAPNLGNRDRLQMNRISRETRGGTLVVYADPIWPKIQTLVLNFSGLSWSEADGLHTFMDDHLGQEVGMLDWEHRFWSGVITKLDDPIVQDGRGCQYSVGFEFEGELATYSP